MSTRQRSRPCPKNTSFHDASLYIQSAISSILAEGAIQIVVFIMDIHAQYLPRELATLPPTQQAIPQIARNKELLSKIQSALSEIPTTHQLHNLDARNIDFIEDKSIHLVVTSPPYWTLKKYNDNINQLGAIQDYEKFLLLLDDVWNHCYRVLVPGGRLVCVVGDVCLSRRKNKGRHTVVPLHASIQEHCRQIGFDNLAPIIWYKIANAVYEAKGNGAGFLGKPYEPNAVIKNDIEFILMERKSGGYRKPEFSTRLLSVIPQEKYREWFCQVWTGLGGASTRNHPAPYPVELADRLVRMFSFVGDTVLDPFAGTGTTTVAAMRSARNSVAIEVDEKYFKDAEKRVADISDDLVSNTTLILNEKAA
jgi:modification methylase